MTIKAVSDRAIQLADQSFQNFLNEIEYIEKFWDADVMEKSPYDFVYTYDNATRKELKTWFVLTLDDNPTITENNICESLHNLVLHALGYKYTGYRVTTNLEHGLEKVFDVKNSVIEIHFTI